MIRLIRTLIALLICKTGKIDWYMQRHSTKSYMGVKMLSHEIWSKEEGEVFDLSKIEKGLFGYTMYTRCVEHPGTYLVFPVNVYLLKSGGYTWTPGKGEETMVIKLEE